jgi:histidinol-phosphatase (PHP family)
MILTNYHTHTRFCDGNSAPEAYVTEAIKKNFKCLGFSAHAPLPFENAWSLADGDMYAYCRSIQDLKETYRDQLEIYLSLEIDYIPGVSPAFDDLKRRHHLDYVLGAVHLVKNPQGSELWFIDGPPANYDKGLNNIFHGDIHLAVGTYYAQLQEMLQTQKPDMVAHFDKVKMNNRQRYFQESETWYRDHITKTLEVIAQSKTIVEVNTRGIYTGKCESLYPGTSVLKQCFELNIPVTVSADAHKPSDINSFFAETEKKLKDIGYKSIKIFIGGAWEDWEIS